VVKIRAISDIRVIPSHSFPSGKASEIIFGQGIEDYRVLKRKVNSKSSSFNLKSIKFDLTVDFLNILSFLNQIFPSKYLNKQKCK
jgi:hypothetical protein